MRMRPNSLLSTHAQLNETTLKQHNKNYSFSLTKSATEEKHLKLLNLQRSYQQRRRGSGLMDVKPDENCIDSGGGCNGSDEVDNVNIRPQMNGDLRRNSFHNKHDRGMVSLIYFIN
jgi:hypothetical protein